MSLNFFFAIDLFLASHYMSISKYLQHVGMKKEDLIVLFVRHLIKEFL